MKYLYVIEIPDDFDFAPGKTKTPIAVQLKKAWMELYRAGKLMAMPKKESLIGNEKYDWFMKGYNAFLKEISGEDE